MMATLSTRPPVGDGWAWELKWDGIRAIGYAEQGALRLVSRNGNDITRRYPELEGVAAALADHDAVLDGEIVAFDDDGRPSFERLQSRMHVNDPVAVRRLAAAAPVAYVLFDLLWLDGASLMDQPYAQRRAHLSALTLAGPWWQTPPHEVGDGAATLGVSKEFGLEGIVAKRLDSRYEAGRRSRAWIKVKHTLRQEFVVGGWQPGERGRTGSIGSLLLGYYDDDGALVYAGRAGSGLAQDDLTRFAKRFATIARSDAPFATGPLPAHAQWVEPEIVVEVRFTEWTSSGMIRHPVYLGELTDHVAADVRRELPT
jgi:bifunctional non-homologous end joining protein LigD